MKKININTKNGISMKNIEDALLASSNIGFYEAKNKIFKAFMNTEGFEPDFIAREFVSCEFCECCGQEKPGTSRSQYYIGIKTRRGENIITPITINEKYYHIDIGFGDVNDNEMSYLMDYEFDWYWEHPVEELANFSFDNRRKPVLSKKTINRIATLTEELLSD